jgi:cobalt/nickel transport system permease protein
MAAITKFFLIFAPTQLPLAVAEGLLTVIIWNGLMSYKPKLLNKLGAIADKELQGE